MSIGNKLRRWWGRFQSAPPPASFDLYQVLNTAWIGQAIYTVTALGVPEALAKKSATCEELASMTGAKLPQLRQVMRALAGFGVFAIDRQNRYSLTPSAESLLPQNNEWMRQYILLWGEQLYQAGGAMLEMVKTGQVACEIALGSSLYEHYKVEPEANTRFVDFMNATTDWQREILLDAYDFSSCRHVVDVGGGKASLLTGLLQKYPNLKGTILDQPHMESKVTARIGDLGLGGRCGFAGGDFFEAVVSGADTYLIKHVLHDWADEDAIRILQRIREAMAEESTLIIIEGVLSEENGTDRLVKLRDLEQMVWTGGKVRSSAEFREILAAAELEICEIRTTEVIDAKLLICRQKSVI